MLVQSEDSATGFRGVSPESSSSSKPFRARLGRNGRYEHLGVFSTAEEAALAYARAVRQEQPCGGNKHLS